MTPEPARKPWQDPALPVAERVDALLAEMTLEEKVGQLGSRWVGNDMQAEEQHDPEETLNVAPMQDVFAASGTIPLDEASRNGLGHLTRVFGSYPLTPSQGAAEVIRQQHIVLANSRLSIPAIVHEECLTGFTTFGATVYPAAIAWGATFDPELVERMAAAIGRDMAAVGVHQGLSPVLDVVRDYRWGRVEETIGEDPYLVALLGAGYVRGLQSAGVIATLKHFAGYSASRGARNHGPVPMGRRELLDVILPTFETAIREAGAGSVMNSYSDIDGLPAVADPWLFTELLRDRWGFTGTVVSDYWAVPFLASTHHVATDMVDAGVQSLTAGIDVELPDTLGFGPGLIGRVPEALIDRAVRRLLTQKVELGLLDADWTPEKSVADAEQVDLDSAANRALARELAERSVVLLDPGSALPLAPDVRKVAVIGPAAADPRTFMGCYAFPNHVLPRYPDAGLGIDVPTAVEALGSALKGSEIVYEQGCAVIGGDKSGFAAAVDAARDADVTVVMVGDLAGLFGHGTSGEGCDAEDLTLPGLQADLIEELLATGKPVVIVVVSGRPYALGAFAGRAAGLVQAFMPGEEGGAAIAGVLTGRINPGAKLPVQIPRHAGGQPGTYLQPALGAENTGVSNLDPAPLFPFGHGRSYTSFELDDLRISDESVPVDGEFTVTVRVRNTGARAGDEVVQLYLKDLVAQVTRPVKQLTGFARVPLEAGEAKDVTFTVHADRTAFTGRDYSRVVEPGELDVLVGTSATDLPCTGRVTLTGELRVVADRDRHLITPVTVEKA
ncbi:glycoside hydrolase family 3 C-terminal domain-containing protein [Actinoplanes sp. TRM 88003]|uniref:Glycoside hydrolase family 3 C-terminal domain-containing protein n=1 Tax=Paractinoplanes aksuensis TaxID=2939490 RepID=A0ABT1DY67_9ACTN|nr:glycoside hydrolase family 3 N-terminal domain-containing protein [Actinoplanes aksuensis]MCO8275794.1 glycoside hydrolase family 3 C-terminal domain-containing protein [Actinoplanes aksuensis]